MASVGLTYTVYMAYTPGVSPRPVLANHRAAFGLLCIIILIKLLWLLRYHGNTLRVGSTLLGVTTQSLHRKSLSAPSLRHWNDFIEAHQAGEHQHQP